jgi:hypothetical protein
VGFGSIRGGALCLGAALLLGLAGCGSSRKLVVSVVSPNQYGVPHATVAIAGKTRLTGTTDVRGRTTFSGLAPGVYAVTVSRRGFYTAKQTLRLAAGRPAVVALVFRPPVGTFVWNIGPAGKYWDEGTVTKTTVSATEYDWVCVKDAKTGKEVGHWKRFPGSLPEASAPNTVAPEWTLRTFPASGPPTPPSGCSNPG